jgi:hypothetical protein
MKVLIDIFEIVGAWFIGSFVFLLIIYGFLWLIVKPGRAAKDANERIYDRHVMPKEAGKCPRGEQP